MYHMQCMKAKRASVHTVLYIHPLESPDTFHGNALVEAGLTTHSSLAVIWPPLSLGFLMAQQAVPSYIIPEGRLVLFRWGLDPAASLVTPVLPADIFRKTDDHEPNCARTRGVITGSVEACPRATLATVSG